jgi:hypothetical protein
MYASAGLLKLTNTMQLDGIKSLDTTILISESVVTLQLDAGILQTLALQLCDVMKFRPLSVTVKPGYTESGTMDVRVGISIDRAPDELFAPALGGLLNCNPTTQDPLPMDLETSAIAMLREIKVQFVINEPQTNTEQICVPLRKFVPETVIMDPANAKFGFMCEMLASPETLNAMEGLRVTTELGFENIISTAQ